MRSGRPIERPGARRLLRAAALFFAAALAEIGGAYLVWQTVRAGAAAWVAAAGAVALVGYGFLASLQADPHFGRVLAAYGGVFVFGSLLWGMLIDGFRPDRLDLVGAATCLVGAAIIILAPR
jgi:small multidrug resistance family-3 protein